MPENRLAREKSPYLLQHADNPVDWYPWGPEAFARARGEDRPIFLSIGYSACHWCHVMERESFEDPEVARLLNDAFVCVKVDREERPDIDAVYMTACQLLSGSGGWPLTAVLTPEGEPFFAGTYFPKRSRYGRIGMLDLVPRLAAAWREQRDEVRGSAGRVRDALDRAAGPPAPGEEPGLADLERGWRELRGRYDALQGGFGSAPKFPSPHTLMFLLRWWRRSGEGEALEMVERTLRAMRRGGIRDHVGFGFHRYSTDARWLVPHFEKMLYDQALISLASLEAFAAGGAEVHARTARETLEYVRRDLRHPEGGFHSAEDADSEGEEGRFYVWTEEELRAALSGDDVLLVKEAWKAREAGNFAEEATGRRTGANILHLGEEPAAIAERLGLEESGLEAELERIRRELFAARERRERPLLDDKVLTDWNGLAIAAFARAAAVLGEPARAETAAEAAEFVLSRLTDADGRLLHRWREGEAAVPAVADDVAFLTWGLLELHQATLEPRWLAEAVRRAEEMLDRHWDDGAGGLFLAPADGERLVVRSKETHDGAYPSANSVALSNLVRLGRLTGDPRWEERAAELGRALGGAVRPAPSGHAMFLCGLDLALGPTREVVVAGPAEAAATRALISVVREGFRPRVVLLHRDPEDPDATAAELAPFAAAMEPVDGDPAAYVCTAGACERPVTAPEDLRERLETETTPGS